MADEPDLTKKDASDEPITRQISKCDPTTDRQSELRRFTRSSMEGPPGKTIEDVEWRRYFLD